MTSLLARLDGVMCCRLPLLIAGVLSLSAAPVGAADGGALTDQEMVAARKLHALKCAKCHELYAVHKYPPVEWEQWLFKMNRKAKLRPEQAELIKRYTASLRVEPAGK